MNRFTLRAACAVVFAFGIFGLQALHADTVRLKNGVEFSGRILREDHREVTIQSAGRVISFKTSQVATVRVREGDDFVSRPPNTKRAEHKRPKNAAARSSSSRSSTGAPVERAPRVERASEYEVSQPQIPVRTRLEMLLTELEQIRLEPWNDARPVKVVENDAKSFKVLTRDGETRMVGERPSGPEGVEELWTRRPCGVDGAYVVVGCFEWRRLFWDAETKTWIATQPGEVAMQADIEKVQAILALAGQSTSPTHSKMITHASALAHDGLDPEEDARHKRALRKIAEEVGSSWSGTELLYELHLTTAALERASAPEEKIRIAESRRGLVRSLVARYPSR